MIFRVRVCPGLVNFGYLDFGSGSGIRNSPKPVGFSGFTGLSPEILLKMTLFHAFIETGRVRVSYNRTSGFRVGFGFEK